jgi:molybdopterin-guanine dinucleotide biosynthesis protein B
VASGEMRVFGLAGWSGSGKTTLIARLLPELLTRGLTVSTVKHAHHDFDIDKPGKDSWTHRQAGATEVMIGSAARWALMHELRDEEEPPLDRLVARMTPVDLLIVEGFKRYPHPKLELVRPSLGKPRLYPEDDTIRAVAEVEPLPEAERAALALPCFAADDLAGIADFVIAAAAPLPRTGQIR